MVVVVVTPADTTHDTFLFYPFDKGLTCEVMLGFPWAPEVDEEGKPKKRFMTFKEFELYSRDILGVRNPCDHIGEWWDLMYRDGTTKQFDGKGEVAIRAAMPKELDTIPMHSELALSA